MFIVFPIVCLLSVTMSVVGCYVVYNAPHYPLIIPWYMLQVISISYQFFTLVQSGFTYTFFSVISAMVFNDKVEYAVQQMREHLTRFQLVIESKKLTYFLVEQNKIVVDIMRSNREVWSRVLFAFFLTNIPGNIYICTRLAIDSLARLEKSILWFALMAQVMAAVMVLFPLASYLKTIHDSAKCLVSVQYHIGSDMLWYKLKIDDLFKRLTSGPKYGVTIGPMHPFSYRAIAEVKFYSIVFFARS